MDFKDITLKNVRREALRRAADEARGKALDLAKTLADETLRFSGPSRDHLVVMEQAFLHASEELLKESVQ